MGGALSKQINNISTRNALIDSFPFESVLNARSYNERFFAYLESIQIEQIQSEVPTDYTLEELINVTTCCREHVANLNKVLQAIISLKDQNDQDFLAGLQSEFNSYLRNSELRKISYDSLHNISRKFNSEFSFPIKYKAHTKEITIDDLLQSFSSACCILKNNKPADVKIIEKVTEYFNNVIPTPCLFLPIMSNFNKTSANTAIINSPRVIPRGITSNGTFVFIITGARTIFIYSMANGLSLSKPMIRNVKEKFSKNAYAYSSLTDLFVCSSKTIYQYSIKQLVLNEEIETNFIKTKSSSNNTIIKVSDSIVKVKINKKGYFDFTSANEADNETNSNIVLAKKDSTSELNDYCKTLLPDNVKHDFTAFTNGSFVCFLLDIPNGGKLVRTFSLLTGDFLSDQEIVDQDIVGLCYDSINMCYFVMKEIDDTSTGLHIVPRMESSIDFNIFDFSVYQKQKIFEKSILSPFATSVSRILLHYVSGYAGPKELIFDDKEKLLSLIEVINNFLDTENCQISDSIIYKNLIECLTVLLNLNLTNILTDDLKYSLKFCSTITDLFKKLPIHLSAMIFFTNIRYFMKELNDVNLSVMTELFVNLQSNEIKKFALNQLENSNVLNRIPFSQINGFNKYILQNQAAPVTKLMTLYYIHQRKLVNDCFALLSTNPFIEIDFKQRNNADKTSLDIFADYFQSIVTKVDSIISLSEDGDKLSKEPVFVLFSNLIRMMSCLVTFHSIARFASALLSVILTKLYEFIKNKNVQFDSQSNLTNFVLLLLFIYSRFASTLVMGGGLSEFEKNDMWLIRGNINLVDQVDLAKSLTQNSFENMDERIIKFIKEEDIGIYYKYKAMLNKKLSDDIILLDKVVILALAKHTNSLEKILSKSETDSDIKKILEQMLRIRNQFRVLRQNDQDQLAQNLFTRSLMLLKMDSKFCDDENPLILVSNFILANYEPDLIPTIIMAQRMRIQTTLVGFALIERTYSMNTHPIMGQVIAYCLSKIVNFDGLAVIARITTLTAQQEKQMNSFFEMMRKQLALTKNKHFATVCFKFFRDMEMFKDQREKFLEAAIDDYHQTNYDPLYALIYFLSLKYDKIPQNIDISKSDIKDTSLLYEIIKNAMITSEQYEIIEDRFFKEKNCLLVRSLGRIILYVLPKFPEKIDNFIQKSVIFVGNCNIGIIDQDISAEIASVARRIFEFDVGREKFNYFIQNCDISIENQIILSGIFSIIGGMIEPMRDYCNTRYLWHGMSTEYITSLSADRKHFICIPHPFVLEDQPRLIENKPNTAILTTQIHEMNRKYFLSLDWLLNCFITNYDNYQPPTKFLLSIAISNFCQERSFVDKMKTVVVDRLTDNLQPFFNVRQILSQINSVQRMTKEPRKDLFSTLAIANSDFNSYVSPILDMNQESFNVTISVPNSYFGGYVGIVSSPCDRFQVRWSLVGIPIGRVYPEDYFLLALPRAKVFQFSVDPKNKVYQIGDKKVQFPFGQKFRIIIGCSKNLHLKIFCSENNFDYDSTNSFTIDPILQKDPILKKKISQIYSVPLWTNNYGVKIPANLNDLPDSDIFVNPISHEMKGLCLFVRPPKDMPLHIGFATSASDFLIEDEIRSLYCLLSEKINTISVMRIAKFDPTKIDKENLIKLFSIICCQNEPFSAQDFMQGQFPFDLYNPVWTQDLHTVIETEKECQICLKNIIQTPNFNNLLSEHINQMINDPAIHLCANLHPFCSIYTFPNRPKSITIRHKLSIISETEFQGFVPEFYRIENNLFGTPLILGKENLNVDFTQVANSSEILVFGVSPLTPEWIFNSPFEILILLKNYAYICTTINDQTKARSFALDLFNVRSPLVSFFIPSLISHLQILIPPTPMYKDPSYISKLLTYGSIIKRMNDERLIQVYNSEFLIYSSKSALQMAPFFPEFFGTKIPEPDTDKIEIKIMRINPGAFNKESLKEYIQLLKLFAHKYTSLVGFPFWEILPLWYRLSDASTIGLDIIPPSLEKTKEGYLHFTNPSELSMNIKFTPKISMSIDTMLAYSYNQFFEDPMYIQGRKIKEVFTTTNKEIYFSCATDGITWEKFEVKFFWSVPFDNNDQNIEIEPKKIHDRFIEDMKNFAVNWTSSDTRELLNILPRSSLCLPTFATTESIAKTSNLAQKYGETVVALKALIIHHFNYIRTQLSSAIPLNLLSGLNSLITSEDAANEVLKCVTVYPKNSIASLDINRKLARQLMMNGGGLPKTYSIVHQVSQQIAKTKMYLLQNEKRPWKVQFTGEAAIDAGGPAHELMTEMAESIIDPTSGLCYPVGQYFVPVLASKDQTIEFRTIGIFLGIVIRSRLPQTLPFAPFIFDFLSGSNISFDNILETDKNLNQMVQNIRENQSNPDFEKLCPVNWYYTSWSGKKKLMNGHNPHELVTADNSEFYINEYLRLRMGEVLPALQYIREGFVENTNMETHPLLTGSLLSHMVQGSPIITKQQIMQSLSVSNGYSSFDDPPIRYFLQALERMNAEQRRQLLRFVTTFTRLPSNNKFRFRIDLLERTNPDESLPTASTCFNKLHLPAYSNADVCYERLAVAIQYCGTMENK